MGGQFELAKVLVKLGCSLEKRTIFGRTPAFLLACVAFTEKRLKAQRPLEVNACASDEQIFAQLFAPGPLLPVQHHLV